MNRQFRQVGQVGNLRRVGNPPSEAWSTIATLLLLGLGVSAHGQTRVDRPQLGAMLDSSGVVRSLYGVPGGILLGDNLATGALSIACSRRLCLIKTDSAILSSTGPVPAPPGPALFALDGETALVYFPASKQLARWHDGQLDFLNVRIPGEVLSLRAGSESTLEAAVRHEGRVSLLTISLENDSASMTGSIPHAGLVMLPAQGILFSNRDGLVLRHRDGTEIRFDVTDADAAFALWDGYAEVRAGHSTYAIRLDPGHEQIFLLPEAME
jgi:hypothetical protein